MNSKMGGYEAGLLQGGFAVALIMLGGFYWTAVRLPQQNVAGPPGEKEAQAASRLIDGAHLVTVANKALISAASLLASVLEEQQDPRWQKAIESVGKLLSAQQEGLLDELPHDMMALATDLGPKGYLRYEAP